jgi:AraC-like DNA-binding protein
MIFFLLEVAIANLSIYLNKMTSLEQSDLAFYGRHIIQADLGIELLSCGYQNTMPGESSFKQGHPASHQCTWEQGRILEDDHILYIPTGRGVFEIEGKIFPVQSGDALLLARGQWHRYAPLNESGWEEYWIGFGGYVLDIHLRQKLFPQGVSCIKAVGFQWTLILAFHHLIEHLKGNSKPFAPVLMGYLLQILGEIAQPKEPINNENRNTNLVRDIVLRIRSQPTQEFDFKSMAQQYHISYSSLRRIFNAEVGVPPQQFVIQGRLEMAKRLLNNTELSLTEISQLCGFQSLSYFSRIYKQKLGLNPSLRK